MASVYNLTVRHTHEYFAEGVLVANCVRYATMLWPEMPEAPTAAEGRDLSVLPEDVRWAIERERRAGAWVPEPEQGLGDFYSW